MPETRGVDLRDLLYARFIARFGSKPDSDHYIRQAFPADLRDRIWQTEEDAEGIGYSQLYFPYAPEWTHYCWKLAARRSLQDVSE